MSKRLILACSIVVLTVTMLACKARIDVMPEFTAKQLLSELARLSSVVIDTENGHRLFNSSYPSLYSQNIDDAGDYSALIIKNNLDVTASVTIRCDTQALLPSNEFTVNDGSVSIVLSKNAKCRLVLKQVSNLEIQSVTIHTEKMNSPQIFVNTAEEMSRAASGLDYSRIVLLSDIEVGELIIRRPMELDLAEKTLRVNGTFAVDTEYDGTFRVRSDSKLQIRAESFFAECGSCDIEFKNCPFTFDGNMSYYIYARTFNGESYTANERTVYSVYDFLRLCDDSQYPRLRDNCKIRYCATDILADELVFNISHPVTLSFAENISRFGTILINTQLESSICIAIETEVEMDASIYIDAPLCTVVWGGELSIPEQTLAQTMRVKSFNNIDLIAKYNIGGTGTSSITDFILTKQRNPLLKADIGFIVEANVISLTYSYQVNENALKNARVDIKVDKQAVSAEFNSEAYNNNGSVNLLSADTYTVTDTNGNTRTYCIKINRTIYNLPVICIETDGGAAVDSRTEYVDATCSVTLEDEGSPFNLETVAVAIRGRGHSSWQAFPKKPYRLKFDSKQSLLGMPKAKDYILISSYADKSLIRNYLASKMSMCLDNLIFVAEQYPVDLFLNGSYLGVYTLSEQIEVKEGRLQLTEGEGLNTGFLLEIGGTSNDNRYVRDKTYFGATTIDFVAVKFPSPDVLTQEQFDYIKAYVNAADNAVVSGGDYEKYIDVDALIDWFIMHEFAFNIDSSFRRSCFMTLDVNGKLKMGPPWDFDLAFGNFSQDYNNYERWVSIGTDEKDSYVRVTWLNYLLEDIEFRSRARARWDEVGATMLETAFAVIDEMTVRIEPSQRENFMVWSILGERTDYNPYGSEELDTYDLNIRYLRNFLQTRYEWIDNNL